MDKKAEMLSAVTASLARCCPVASFYRAGEIPDKKFRNACKAYAGPVELSNCIGMTDETTLGSGKRGFLFTYDGFYASGIQGLKYYMTAPQFKDLPGFYDLDAFNDLLGRLHAIAMGIPGPDAFLAQLTALAGTVLKTPVQDPAQMQRTSKDWDAGYIETLYALRGWLDRMRSEVVDELRAAKFPILATSNCNKQAALYLRCFFRLDACLAGDRAMLETFEHDGLTTAQRNALEAVAQVLALLQAFLTQYTGVVYSFDLAGAIWALHSDVMSLAEAVYEVSPTLAVLRWAFGKAKDILDRLDEALMCARGCMTRRFDAYTKHIEIDQRNRS